MTCEARLALTKGEFDGTHDTLEFILIWHRKWSDLESYGI